MALYEVDELSFETEPSSTSVLDRRLNEIFNRSFSDEYRKMTVKNYGCIDITDALTGHEGLLSRVRGYIADPQIQAICQGLDPLHDSAPDRPALGYLAHLAIGLNRHLSDCRNPSEAAWLERRRNEFECAFLVPLAEMTAGQVRLQSRNQSFDGERPGQRGDNDSDRVRPTDYQRCLRVTTPIRCRTRSARALVDFQVGMTVEGAFDCFLLAAGTNASLQEDLAFYWEQVENMVGGDLDERCLTDLYRKAQDERNGTPLVLLFRCLLIIPMAKLYRAGLFDATEPAAMKHATELDRKLAQASA